MKKRISLTLLLYQLTVLILFCQPNKRTNYWFFGKNVGIDFNSGVPIENSNSPIYNEWQEGSTIMSDTNGSLLFYSDGKYVWNKNHHLIKNFFKYPEIPSTYQSSIAIKKPQSDDIYYIFLSSLCNSPNRLPLIYYTIDMSKDNGLGELIEIDTINTLYDVAEKITACYHKNKQDIWLVTRRYEEDSYASIYISNGGVNEVPVLSYAPNRELSWGHNNFGPMKISYNNKFIASTFEGNHSQLDGFIEICQFDNLTGIVNYLYTFQLRYSIPNSEYYEESSCEFSPCSKYLYVAGEVHLPQLVHIFQFDVQYIIDSIAFIQSAVKIGDIQGSNLQLASDGKIYCVGRSAFNNPNNLLNNIIGVISDPGKKGLACNYIPDLFSIQDGQVTYSIANFFNYYLNRFDFDGICESDTFTFDPWFFPEPTYIEWNFGDPLSGINNTSTIPHATHKFTDGGTYEVSVYVEYPSGRIEETSRKVEVEYAPEPDLGPDTSFCSSSGITLDAECGPHIYVWSNGAFGSSQIIVSDTGWYWVRVESDAGCFEIDSIHLSYYPPSLADTSGLEIKPTTCGGSTGVIRGLLINGQQPLSWHWLDDMGDTVSTSLDIYHLPVGNYTLEVLDGNGCITAFGPYGIHDAGEVLIDSLEYTIEHCEP